MSKEVINHTIHEHNSGLGYIVNAVYMIKQLVPDNKEVMEQLDNITRGKNKCKDAIDYLYTNLKNE